MKKILYVTTVSSTINAFLVPHIKYLIEQGYKVDVATNITDEVDKSLIDIGARVFKVDFQRTPISLKNSRAYKQIREIQKNEKYDMVHVHTPVASFVTRYALRKEKNLKIIYTCHGFHFYKGGSILNWMLFYPIEYLAARWTDILININNEDFEIGENFKLRKNGRHIKINGVGIEPEKYYIENFDLLSYKQKLGFDRDDFIILVISELNKNKNHIQLIKAMSILKDKYPNIKAIFAGVGPLEEQILKDIKFYNIENKIKLLGWRTDIKELINTSDIVGLFSKREGLPKCILEAMICGKSTIATNIRGSKTLVRHNLNGLLVEVGNYEQVAVSIEKLYNNSNTREKFKSNAVKIVKDYSLKNILCELDKVYREEDDKSISFSGEII